MRPRERRYKKQERDFDLMEDMSIAFGLLAIGYLLVRMSMGVPY